MRRAPIQRRSFEVDSVRNNSNRELKFTAKFEIYLVRLEKVKKDERDKTQGSLQQRWEENGHTRHDMKIRVFNFTTCKLKAVFNEDLSWLRKTRNDPVTTSTC